MIELSKLSFSFVSFIMIIANSHWSLDHKERNSLGKGLFLFFCRGNNSLEDMYLCTINFQDEYCFIVHLLLSSPLISIYMDNLCNMCKEQQK